MRQAGRLRRRSAAAVALALAAGLAAAPSSARKFQMSGTWLVRKGNAFIPLQFGGSLGGTQMTHVSMGNWTEAPFYPPGQVVAGGGGVSATGSDPAALVIPRHRWVSDHSTGIPFSCCLVQLTTMFQVDAPFTTASFMEQ